MFITKKIILSLMMLSSIIACEKKVSLSTNSGGSGFKTETELPDDFKKCKMYKVQVQELCGKRDEKGRCVLQSSEDVLKALEIVKSLPQISDDLYTKYEKFFANKSVRKDDISAYFPLVATDCWKTTELKLWKALTRSYENNSEHNDEIAKSLEAGILRVQKTPMSIVRLMINIVMANNWASSGLLKVKAGSLENLKSIKSELKLKAKGISKKFDTVFKPFIDEQNGTVPKSENLDLTDAYNLLSEEQQLIKSYSEKLKKWIQAESK